MNDDKMIKENDIEMREYVNVCNNTNSVTSLVPHNTVVPKGVFNCTAFLLSINVIPICIICLTTVTRACK